MPTRSSAATTRDDSPQEVLRTSAPAARLVETDARGRASLGRPDSTYLMHEEPDGTLILEPAAVMSELERRFLMNAALQARIDYARAHPEQSQVRQPRRKSGRSDKRTTKG
jgi:hypothetical protein